MTATVEELTAALRNINNITSGHWCSICTETFSQPRALPCAHTFCLGCLEEYGRTRRPGGEMSCPLCRQTFQVPDDGLSALPRNIYAEDLAEIGQISAEAVRFIPCDSCALDGDPTAVAGLGGLQPGAAGAAVPGSAVAGGGFLPPAGTGGVPATMYCLECRQNFCDECSRKHRKAKLTKTHKVVPRKSYKGG